MANKNFQFSTDDFWELVRRVAEIEKTHQSILPLLPALAQKFSGEVAGTGAATGPIPATRFGVFSGPVAKPASSFVVKR